MKEHMGWKSPHSSDVFLLDNSISSSSHQETQDIASEASANDYSLLSLLLLIIIQSHFNFELYIISYK